MQKTYKSYKPARDYRARRIEMKYKSKLDKALARKIRQLRRLMNIEEKKYGK